jgi:hypothetical protein
MVSFMKNTKIGKYPDIVLLTFDIFLIFTEQQCDSDVHSWALALPISNES